MKQILSLWNNFWFSAGSKTNFVLIRTILFTGGAIFGFFVVDSHPPGFYEVWTPISFYHLLEGPLSHTALRIFWWVWIVSGFIAGFGIYYRWTSLITFISGAIFLGHDYNFGVVYHSHHVYIMSVGILAISENIKGLFKSGNALLDERLYYRWSLQWMRLYIVYVFFICGLEKLWKGGPGWALSESFYIRLWINPYQPPLALWILSKPLFVSQIFAFWALFIVELAAPLAFLNRKMGVFFFFAWSFFHVGVTLTYGNHVTFYSSVFAYAVFIDWDHFSKQYTFRNAINAYVSK